MSRPPKKIYRQEFEALAGISKTRFFDLLADPQIAAQLDVGIDDNGRYANRRKALAFIEGHRARREAARLKVRENLGAFATRTPGPRGRPCPACGKRITRKRTACRHCGVEVPAAA